MTDAENARMIADLVRIGCAAVQAMPVPTTDMVEIMRRDRLLRVGRAFLLATAEAEATR